MIWGDTEDTDAGGGFGRGEENGLPARYFEKKKHQYEIARNERNRGNKDVRM